MNKRILPFVVSRAEYEVKIWWLAQDYQSTTVPYMIHNQERTTYWLITHLTPQNSQLWFPLVCQPVRISLFHNHYSQNTYTIHHNAKLPAVINSHLYNLVCLSVHSIFKLIVHFFRLSRLLSTGPTLDRLQKMWRALTITPSSITLTNLSPNKQNNYYLCTCSILSLLLLECHILIP